MLAQAELSEDWRLRLALGYESGDLDALDNRHGSQSETVHGGTVLRPYLRAGRTGLWPL